MPLNQGFPPTNLISPSVRLAETDLSFLTTTPSGHIAGLVGFASKGPVNIPTLVSSSSQLHTIFGQPHPDVGDPYLLYAGDQYLTQGSQLFVVRVADTSAVSPTAATTASVVVPTAGGMVQITGNATSFNGDGHAQSPPGTNLKLWSFKTSYFFRWRLNGVLSSKILVVLADHLRPGSAVLTAYSTTDLVNALNMQLSPAIDGIQFGFDQPTNNAPTDGTSHITVTSTFAYGPNASIELVSVGVFTDPTGYITSGQTTVGGCALYGLNTWITGNNLFMPTSPDSNAPALSIVVSDLLGASPGSVPYSVTGCTFSSAPYPNSDGAIGNSPIGIGNGMQQATIAGTTQSYESSTPGTFDLVAGGFSSSKPAILNVVVDGSGSVLIDNVVQTVSVPVQTYTSAADVCNCINNIVVSGQVAGGFYAWTSNDSHSTAVPVNAINLSTMFSGQDAAIALKSSSTVAAALGLDATQLHSGFTPAGVTGGSTGCLTLGSNAPPTETPVNTSTSACGLVTGSASSGITCFTITADSPGIDGNLTSVVITNSTSDNTFSFAVYNGDPSTGNFAPVETWGRLTKDPTSGFYVETIIAQGSNYIRVIDNTQTLGTPAASTAAAPYQLSGGSDGIPANPDTQDILLIGSSITKTGLEAMSDPEQINIDMVAVPGHTSTAVTLALIDFCQNQRGDCFAILDTPFGLDVTEVIQWQNGVHPLNDTQFNSDFAALYWPWLQYRDTYNHVNVWVPPSGSVMQAIARSDGLAAPWYAPAGATRGLVQGITDVFTRPSLADRDAMYGGTNCINPIIQFVDLTGFYIWGQKTTQRLVSALDRVNVRRMLIYVEKQIKVAARNILFDPNDTTLWGRFIALATPILETVKQNHGLTDYQIQCDATINTPQTIAMNQLNANIGIQPTYAAEFIFILFTINRLGNFAEATTANF